MPVGAAAQTRADLQVSVGTTAASNPYLLDAPDTEAIGANLTLAPTLNFLDGDTSVTLDGRVSLEKFADKYGLDESVFFGGTGEHRIDERTKISTEVGFRTSESAARNFFGGADLSDLAPGEFPDSVPIDPTVGSLDGRTSQIDVSASVERVLSPNSVLAASAGLSVTRTQAGSGRDFRNTSLAANLSRRLTARTGLLVSVDGGYADYFGQRAGDGLFVNAMAGVDHQYSEALNLSVQLGASLAELESALAGVQSFVSWAGNVELCDRSARGTLCASASRSAQPTARGGVTTVSSLGMSYSRTVGPWGTLSASATYGRTSRSRTAGVILNAARTELASLGATYRHKLGDRVSAFVAPSATSISDEFSGARENYQVVVGVSYDFGPAR